MFIAAYSSQCEVYIRWPLRATYQATLGRICALHRGEMQPKLDARAAPLGRTQPVSLNFPVDSMSMIYVKALNLAPFITYSLARSLHLLMGLSPTTNFVSSSLRNELIRSAESLDYHGGCDADDVANERGIKNEIHIQVTTVAPAANVCIRTNNSTERLTADPTYRTAITAVHRQM